MQGNPYIMSLITQAGVIITAVLSFITALVQIYSNKKSKQSDETLITFKNDVNSKLQDNENSNKAMKEATIAMLRSQIISKCESYQKIGYLPEYARYCLTELFEQYTALGGNHGVNILVDEILKLPSIKINKN
ncbi:MAG: hypothetical protein II393_00260 [Cytophagales bacterium]|nr:hypothetical protein [Cytophagales bacterium]